MKPLTILLAEDEEHIRALLDQWLSKLGCTVVATASGVEARRALSNGPCDLIVTDVLMPDGDGIDLIVHAKRQQPTGRILAMSGGGRYLGADDCLKIARGLGAHATVMKPFTREEFLAAIAEAMQSEPKDEN